MCGYKSRGNFASGVCIRDCQNRDRKCDVCIFFSKYAPPKEERHVDELEKRRSK